IQEPAWAVGVAVGIVQLASEHRNNLSDGRGRRHSGRNNPVGNGIALPAYRASCGSETRSTIRACRIRAKRVEGLLALGTQPIGADVRRGLARGARITWMGRRFFLTCQRKRGSQRSPAIQQKEYA